MQTPYTPGYPSPFMRGDTIRLLSFPELMQLPPLTDPETGTVVEVLVNLRSDKTAEYRYDVQRDAPGLNGIDRPLLHSFSESQLQLVEHGLLWKCAHDEPVTCDCILKLADALIELGRFDRVETPVSPSWRDALTLIKRGKAHGYTVRRRGTYSHLLIYRLHNEAIGQQVAKELLSSRHKRGRVTTHV